MFLDRISRWAFTSDTCNSGLSCECLSCECLSCECQMQMLLLFPARYTSPASRNSPLTRDPSRLPAIKRLAMTILTSPKNLPLPAGPPIHPPAHAACVSNGPNTHFEASNIPPSTASSRSHTCIQPPPLAPPGVDFSIRKPCAQSTNTYPGVFIKAENGLGM